MPRRAGMDRRSADCVHRQARGRLRSSGFRPTASHGRTFVQALLPVCEADAEQDLVRWVVAPGVAGASVEADDLKPALASGARPCLPAPSPMMTTSAFFSLIMATLRPRLTALEELVVVRRLFPARGVTSARCSAAGTSSPIPGKPISFQPTMFVLPP